MLDALYISNIYFFFWFSSFPSAQEVFFGNPFALYTAYESL